MEKVIGLLYLFNVLCNSGSFSCRTHVCLNWKVSLNELMLICKIDNLHLKVFIGDQYGNTQADCLPPRPFSKCDPYYKNGSISQNPRTNETIYIVKGNIDYHINGNWTCRHGTRKDVAHVEVTVIKIQENNKDTECVNNSKSCNDKTHPPDTNCIRNVLLTGTMSVIASITICSFVLPFTKIRFKKIDECFSRITSCACIGIQHSKKIIVCKRLVITVSTIIFLIFSVLLGWLDNKSCISQWVVIGLGIVFGVINALLFLNTDDVNQKLGEGQQQTLIHDITYTVEEQSL